MYQDPRGMQVVKVKKDKLLEDLRRNRTEHREIFLEALEARINEARANKRVNLYFDLSQPTDQTKEYDRIIKMLEMSIDDEIELTQKEFANYVMDDWDWMNQFLSSNVGYSQRTLGSFGV